jgi:hypothetical protein
MPRIFTVVVIGFVSLVLLMSCSRSSNQKVADAKANVIAAKQDLKDAVADAQAAAKEEWLNFKNEAEAKIEANDKIVAEYKTKMTTTNGKLRAQYDKKIDALEKKNKVLKVKLDEYQDSGKNAWEQFKSEFTHDMDELGTALKDFTVDNKK